VARVAIVRRRAHLDELVRLQRSIDLLHDFFREALVADDDDGVELVRLGAQFTSSGRGEGCHGRIVPFVKKSHSSKQWLRRHVNDPYVQRSKKEGFRSRSAYKLLEIDERDKLLKGGQVVVDLGSAPGGWSQVAAKKGAAVVAIDLREMESIPGVEFVQADFTSPKGLKAIEGALAGRKADIVLSDMAPNMTGIPVTDQARSMALAEMTLDFARLQLKPDGALLVKVFQGAGHAEFIKALRATFAKVLVRKPESSRDESAEQYVLARGLKAAATP